MTTEQQSAEHYATKIASVAREIDARIHATGMEVAQLHRQLGTLLAQREAGKSTKAADISAARKALAAARLGHDDALAVKEVVQQIAQEAKEQAQTNRSEELYALSLQNDKIYNRAEQDLDRDWRSLSRQELHARGIALRNLASKARAMSSFRATVSAWANRSHGDVLDGLA